MSQPLDPIPALRLAKRLIDEALPQFNWGASPLSAEAVRLLNDVPAAVNAALAAIDARPVGAEIPAPRQRGPLCAADAEALRLDLGATTLLILTRDRASRAAGALTSIFGTTLISHDVAQTLWSTVATRIRDEAAAAEASPPTERQEPTP